MEAGFYGDTRRVGINLGCTLKFAMGHENSLAAPIWRIRIQYGASVSLVHARHKFLNMTARFLEKLYNLFCIQLTSGPRAASVSSLLFLLSISIFRVVWQKSRNAAKEKKILLDPNQGTILCCDLHLRRT